MEWFLVCWLFIVGACVGSFLNVVIYRVPAGKSLMWPGSRCPACGHAIRARHNVPILGWLALKGKCYDCQAPISVRYPVIELITGIVFFAIAVPEFALGGSNLFNPLGVEWPLWLRGVVYAIHVVMMCVLLVAGQIAWDGKPVPLAMPLVALVAAGAALLAVPQLKPLLFASGMSTESPAAALAFRLLAGTVAGLTTRPAMPRGAAGWRKTSEMCSCLALVAIVLGWQAVAQICALSGLVYLLCRYFGRRNRFFATSPRSAYAGLATFLSILFVKPSLAWMMRYSLAVQLSMFGGLLALALLFSFLAGRIQPCVVGGDGIEPITAPSGKPKRESARRRGAKRRQKS